MTTLPILRFGRRYDSLDTRPVPSVGGRGGDVAVGLANAGLVRRDLRRLDGAREALRAVGVHRLIAAVEQAADGFRDGTLDLFGTTQTPQQYVEACADSTGLPHTLVRGNMDKLHGVMSRMGFLLDGLLLGLDPAILETGLGQHAGHAVGFAPRARSLAAVLPSNSPGVHSLWLPALPLLTPVALKPGAGDPWTPLRLVAALVEAGVPAEAFAFYPSEHDVADELVEAHDRAIVFGGPALARRYAGREDVEVHGPGYAKIVFGDDVDPLDHVDLVVESVARNGGRSCINASTVVVPRGADALAEALAERLVSLEPRPLDDPEAGLAAWSDPAVAEAIDGAIDASLAQPGARDVTAARRDASRHETLDGLAFLRPTVVRAEPDHPLAFTEHGFPFVSVVELPTARMVEAVGPTLVASVVSDDEAFRRAWVAAPHIDRLHLGAVPTSSIRWDQPHEGNLFDWLWRRRAVAWKQDTPA